jgi:hypothetical protein
MGNAPKESFEDQKDVRIRRGRVDSVDLYEVKDGELDLLEKGSPAGLQLNFAVFLLSLAFSGICALATATFANRTIQSSFLLVSIVGIFGGVYLLLCWYRSRASIAKLCKRIRDRIPPDVRPPNALESPVETLDDDAPRTK